MFQSSVVASKMQGFKVALLLCGLAAVSALPQPRRDWPDRPDWWLEALPWPPALPDSWPDRPDWWPDCAAWPPQLPGEDPPGCWPDNLPWPPALPDQWPDRPDWWPEQLPWPPALPEQWPDRPDWWPEQLPWPPALPDQWPDRPEWWPESLPWPPALPDDIPWPPPDAILDRIPYIPSRDNRFHLFTRNNPTVSQPLVFENANLLAASNYDGSRRTTLLVHDIRGTATDSFNALMVPAFLAAGDVNVIIIDWSAGAKADFHVALSTFFSALSGNFVSRFVTWLTAQTNGNLDNFHAVGVGLGALNAGFIARRLDSKVGYVTALDPSRGPAITGILPALNPDVAKYSEVIHTDAGATGFTQPLGDVDFYPNGGSNMPGCGGDSECNRLRAVFYFAESLQTGGFTGKRCESFRDALKGACEGPETLNMGGLLPKTGKSGVFHLATNAVPPFSQG